MEHDHSRRHTAPPPSNFHISEEPLKDIVDIIGRPAPSSSFKSDPQQSPLIGLAIYNSNMNLGVNWMWWGDEDTGNMGVPVLL